MRRAAAATHRATTAVTGKRDYGAARPIQTRGSGNGRTRPARHRDEEGAAQGSQGSGQHYWCCLPGASDIGAGLVVAVVVEQ